MYRNEYWVMIMGDERMCGKRRFSELFSARETSIEVSERTASSNSTRNKEDFCGPTMCKVFPMRRY